MNHRKHSHRILDTSHIRNVGYLVTHGLVECSGSCRFYGWILKEEV